MFYFLVNRTFRSSIFILLVFGVFLFFMEEISAYLISSMSGVAFSYVETPFLELIYLLLLVVTIGFLSALNRNDLISENKKRTSVLAFLLLTISATMIGLGIHVYAVVDTILSKQSMMDLENNIFLYYITDFFLMLGFIVGGFKFLRPAIHQS